MEKGAIWDINRILIDTNTSYWLNLPFLNHRVHVFLPKHSWTCTPSSRKITSVWHFGCNFSVGLDPADPYFQGTDVRVRLDPSDADFVDVIHTDGSSILQLGFGTMQQMGHVDFYPNGGAHQPGCDADFMGTLSHTVWAAVTQLDTLGIKLDQKLPNHYWINIFNVNYKFWLHFKNH